MTTPTQAEQQLIDEAAETLAAAHAALELALGQVTGAVRADKTMISDTIRTALDRLNAAQLRLSQLKETRR